ncbi:hypothetical protein HOLleu_37326 [Holothuria leucospilota]|uniref:Uncharacterized protein n=1 Tax=Holothuria leucospilota TaxID=206669 RepID=A0A9Q1BEN8_HOLLE|nr:hypothetical protein HOLleu_37326 [Holothuria leucospilota]
MSSHISKICQSASYSLYRIGKICNFLDLTSTGRLIHAFVSSHLDYCNSLLCGKKGLQLSLNDPGLSCPYDHALRET